MQTALGVLGAGVAFFSAIFAAALVGELVTGGDGKTSFGAYLGLLVFLSLTLAGGAWLAWTRLWRAPAAPGHRKPTPDAAEREQRILDLAEQRTGRVTVAEVASKCDLTVDQSKAALDTLVLQGITELQVSESGVLVYVFPGFLSDDEKSRAEGI